MTDLVRVRGLSVTYGSGPGAHRAVRGVDLTVAPGRCVALVGESGSGKTTVARTLLGLAGPAAAVSADALEVDGRDARAFGERDWRAVRGRFAGLVLQDALVSLDPLRSVEREIREALRARETRLPRAERRAEVHRLLGAAGVPDPERRARQHAHQLSGGLRQRALIASAVAADPRLLVADEPTTALDVSVQRQVLELLSRQKTGGRGLLLVSHDLAVVAEIADHVLILRDGEVVEEGDPRVLLDTPEHPYTRSLVAAIPTRDRRGGPLAARPGMPPAVVPVAVADGAAPTLSAPEVPAAEPVLVARDLRVRFQQRGRPEREAVVALDGVDVTVRAGRTLGVVGESGSGKSTLLHVLLGLREPDSGSVTLDGAPWSGVPERARRPRRRGLQIVAQDPLSAFDPRYSVRQVLAEARRGTGDDRRTTDRVLRAALDDVGLPATVLERQPLQLSGGQRQRVAIARALCAEPRVLFCDEAVSALDVVVQAQVLDLLADLQRERGIAMVFVSHDLGVVHHVSHDVVVLRHGAVVEEGPVEQVYGAPRQPYTRSLFADLPRALGVGTR